MIEIVQSRDLDKLTATLDNDWESGRIGDLPFPLAYILQRLRAEEYA